MSQDRLAERAGCSARTVGYLERGSRAPNPTTLADLARALRCEPYDLLTDDALMGSFEDTTEPAPRPFGSLPPRPRTAVGRERDVEAIRAGLTGFPGRPLVVHGWPGVGKTTVSLLVAHDPHLQGSLPDGVLWCSLGQEPDVGGELRAWARAARIREAELTSLSVDQLSSRLAYWLQDRRVRLVIDDVWTAQAVKPFLVGGPESATLVTTRLSALADDLAGAGTTYRLDVLAHDACLRLLRGVIPTIVDNHKRDCEELVDALEGLPLAIHVAARLLRREERAGFTVANLIRDLSQDARPVHQAVVPADLACGSAHCVAALLARSTDVLDPATRERFAMLGVVVPKPAVFSAQMAAAAWHTTDPASTLRELVDRGLIELVDDGNYQIHALLAVHAQALLEAL